MKQYKNWSLISGVTTIQEDITTDSCKSKLRAHLKDWKADVVLNDGAPNVGKNWHVDAFSQAEITLMGRVSKNI